MRARFNTMVILCLWMFSFAAFHAFGEDEWPNYYNLNCQDNHLPRDITVKHTGGEGHRDD